MVTLNLSSVNKNIRENLYSLHTIELCLDFNYSMEVEILSLDISGIEELPNYNLGEISNIPNTFLYFFNKF